ncbi:hypothetical protein PSHT_02705 [Puccinia striiformis]|uniref:Uncharacterized protein n=1 Tax=Puccinia striiformis TaxID=27350 RepID=A0A2S4WH99_9BASI|nr:hypothetical protein PSHT_02705 [Puccinia striiformis]
MTNKVEKVERCSLYKQLRIVGRSRPAGIVVYTLYPTSRALCVSAFDILQVTRSIQVVTLTYLGLACTLLINQVVSAPRAPPDMYCNATACPKRGQRAEKTLKVTGTTTTLTCGAFRGTHDCDFTPVAVSRQCYSCLRIVYMARDICVTHPDVQGRTLEKYPTRG